MRFTQFKQKIALTSSALFFAVPSFATELLSNGGFESGTAGWTIVRSGVSGTSSGESTSTGENRTGSSSFDVYDNVAPGLSLSQSVTSGSDTKTLSFLIRTVDLSGTSTFDDLSVTSL